jgi:hypothetical protein
LQGEGTITGSFWQEVIARDVSPATSASPLSAIASPRPAVWKADPLQIVVI